MILGNLSNHPPYYYSNPRQIRKVRDSLCLLVFVFKKRQIQTENGKFKPKMANSNRKWQIISSIFRAKGKKSAKTYYNPKEKKKVIQ